MKEKLLCFGLTVLLSVSFVLPNHTVHAVEKGKNMTDPYVYEYKGNSTETSSHRFTFQWWYKDSAREKVRNRFHDTNIFQIVNTAEDQAINSAYCSDFLYSIVSQTKYRQLNLEDSTYYSQAAAQHIRSIMEKGYWHDWTSEDLKAAEEAANLWIETYDAASFKTDAFLPYDAEEEVNKITGLTADEALMATQLAIWAFANTEGDDWWVKYYESLPTETEGRFDYQELPDNVKAFRKYLIHQQSKTLTPENMLFSDQFFVTDSVIFTAETPENSLSHFTIKVKLAAPVDSRDDLLLTVVLPDGSTKDFSLTGEGSLKPDADGYYSLPVNAVTEEAASKVTLRISGRQYVDGVYFYEAKAEDGSSREASQNLVGKASGMTPVSASTDLSCTLGDKTIALQKSDAEEGIPLSGAIFNLYGEKNGKSFLVLEDLYTDETGKITISSLRDDYAYYFVETKAPDGYFLDDDNTRHYVNDHGETTVCNEKMPVEKEDEQKEDNNEDVPNRDILITPHLTAPLKEPPLEEIKFSLPVSSKDSSVTTEKSSEETSPETGDSSQIGAYLLLSLLSVFGLLYIRKTCSA